MTGRTTTERILDAYLAPEADRLPDRVIDAALADIARTPQRRAVRVPWRFPTMPALSRATGIAAVALVAAVGAGGLIYLNSPGGDGGSPTPTTPPTPTSPPPSSTSASTPKPVSEGLIGPGVYAVKATWAADPALTVTFTLTEPWEWFGNSLIPEPPGPGGPGGLAIQFLDVTSLNQDPCHWRGTDGDADAGATVDDLVAALQAQTANAVSDPVDVRIGGYSGQRIDITGPTEPFARTGEAPACDEGVVRLWSTRQHGESAIYLQGPANRWQANILDVDGTRLVVVAQDFPGTTAGDRARLDAVLGSFVIEP